MRLLPFMEGIEFHDALEELSFVDCFRWAIGNADVVMAYRNWLMKNGLPSPQWSEPRSAIDKMIDDATGFTPTDEDLSKEFAQFARFVKECIWGDGWLSSD